MTIFVSTPYMDEAERCHRVALMDRGRMLMVDTPENIRKGMRGEIIEVTAVPQRAAREALAAHPDVLGIQIFGDRLHVWVTDAGKMEAELCAYLSGKGLEGCSSRRLSPGLEDVFVSILSSPSRGGETNIPSPPRGEGEGKGP